MRVLILGASGLTGTALCREALARGHAVTALVRSPEKVAKDVSSHASAAVRGGDPLDLAVVQAALASAPHDAVLVALGGGGIMARDYIRSTATKNVIAAMEATPALLTPGPNGGARLVICSSMGASESKPWIPSFIFWMLSKVLDDHTDQEAAVRASKLSWTIARPTGLTKEPRSSAPLRVALSGPVATNTVSRSDVAAFMLDSLTSAEYVGKAPGLCKPA